MLITIGFGCAKPKPINPFKFKNRKLRIILVSIAEPISNIILTKISISNAIIYSLVVSSIWYNVILVLFNLLSLPRLDGSRI